MNPFIRTQQSDSMGAFRYVLLSILIAFLVLECTACFYGKPRKDPISSTGYYIPRDLDDALIELDRIMGPKGRREVRNRSEKDMIDYHRDLGMWIRNNWLKRESPLLLYFTKLGVRARDDMSGIIFDSYWRKLHGVPIDLEGQVQYYSDYWKNVESIQTK